MLDAVDEVRAEALDVAGELDVGKPVEDLLKLASDAGCSIGHLALAFVCQHPAVTSAIIGPRTMDQLTGLLAGQDVRLDADVLDRIDEIVPPGTSISGTDPWQPRALSARSRRRSSG